MTTQPELFSPFASTSTAQPQLFAGSEIDCHCPECGRYLVETSGGFWTCPAGCGKLLIPDEVPE